MNAAEALPHLLEALRAGRPVVEIVALAGVPEPGARLLVSAEETVGGLGDRELDGIAVELAREALRDGRPLSREVLLNGREVLLYLEPHHGAGDLVIVGAGHIAQPLARVGAMLGYRVTVVDDRAEFATRERFPEANRVVRGDFSEPLRDLSLGPHCHLVLVTRGHRHDFEVLRQVLAAPEQPAYIGMIGSRRRVRAAFEQLAAEGVPADRLAEIYAPVGLDLGAETPAEIAVAVAAELVRLRRGGTGDSLRDRAGVVRRWLAKED